VKVSAPTRLDWVFAVANQSPAEAPQDWLPGYESTAQSYERYVPQGRRSNPGLVLFISPGPRSTSAASFRRACDLHNLIYAGPHNAGNTTAVRQRVRIVLDVLDDVRRKHGVDPDRTFVAGFSGGGRIACAIGFALPEHFGGVIPICASGDLRQEPWLRHRVIDRLSVAHLTGVNDFNRGEVERYRGPMLAASGVRSKVWVAPKVGHAMPPAEIIDEAVRWLDDGLESRRKLAESYPATRAPADAASRQSRASQLLAEGKGRISDKQTLYSGLMLLKGVADRWPDLPAASEAKTILLEQESSTDRSWVNDQRAERLRLLIAHARGLSDYATGPLPQPYLARRGEMARVAIQEWEAVIQDGQDVAAVAEARQRLAQLEKLAADKK
jgi:predicted esterase